MKIIKNLFLMTTCLFLTSCEWQNNCDEQCENFCCNCACCCQKSSIKLNLENYKKYLKNQIIFDITDSGTFYSLQFSGILNFAVYDVKVTFQTVNVKNIDDKEYEIFLDALGNGKTDFFMFDFSGNINDFNGFKILDVTGMCYF